MRINVYAYLAVMAGVTLAIRVLPLTLIRRQIENRFLQSFRKFRLRTPAEPLDFCGINGITVVVPGSVRNKADTASIRPHKRQKRFQNRAVAFLLPRADIINLSRCAPLQNQVDCGAMVKNIKPIPLCTPVAVQRQALPAQRSPDHIRNQLFGILIRPVIIRAAADCDAKAVCARIGKHQKIPRRLGSGAASENLAARGAGPYTSSVDT